MPKTPEGALLKKWREDPVSFVRECLGAEPDAWQVDVLRDFAVSQRIAMKACKGPGKSCVLAWIILNFSATRPDAKIAVTSISADNLSDGLWTEIAKWIKRSPLMESLFTWGKTRIYCNESPETWWVSARSWSRSASTDQQADTLAGLHADYLLFILDEVGGIPDGVMAAAEAGLSTGIETKIVIAGNPTHLSGPLYRACTKERHLWKVHEITGDPDDPKRSPRISVAWAKEQIEKYGADSPWVLVNVFGKFPPSSINSLLGVDEVVEAMNRFVKLSDYINEPKALGIDVARQGDDKTVLFMRQGKVAFKPVEMRNADGDQIAGRAGQIINKHGVDGTFVDTTGGWGWSAVDSMRRLGQAPTPVEFAGKALNPLYFNKRTEIHFELAKWVKEGGCLPNIPELVPELTETTYTFKGDKMLLEPKELIKVRLGRSPDLADALALTFSFTLARARRRIPGVEKEEDCTKVVMEED